jgi:transposase-like protein
MSATAPIKPRPVRRRSGTAKWHMSRAAIDLSLDDVYRMEDKECMELLVHARFGGWKTVRCPKCGSIDSHYWRAMEKRWKCSGCGKAFSVTSETVFADRKLKLQDLLAGALLWINSSAGQPALELKRHFNKTYNSAFTLQHKLREALMRGYNVGLLSGDIEIDGAHQSGRRAAEKRGRPQGKIAVAPVGASPAPNAAALTGTSKVKARQKFIRDGRIDPDFGKKLPKDRRFLITVRKRSGRHREGAAGSRVAIGLIEDKAVAEAVIRAFVAKSESFLNTDTANAYEEPGEKFIEHRTVEHGERLVGPRGENNNLSEELNFRFDRAERGVYLNLEPKYLLDYAVETAFRADTRRLPNGSTLRIAFSIALNVGLSHYWRGFTHGRHRTLELLHPEPQFALSSGPAKRRDPFLNATGRPPR